jgi:hypothetical protein
VTGRKFKHGRNGYVFHRCRCDVCKKAESEYTKKYKEKEAQKKRWMEDGFKHGTNGYLLGCRCDVCKKAESDAKKRRRLKNGDHIRECERNRLRLHAKEHRARVRKYQEKNPEKQKKNARLYTLRHPDRIKDGKKRYYKENADKIRAFHRKYQREQYCVNLDYRIGKNLRSRLHGAVTRDTKSAHTIELLGCTVLELKEKLSKMFAEGMSWDNYGEWNIDHVIPCAAFDLTNPKHQRACFNWKNLQPLWVRDNRRKNDSIPENVDVQSYIEQFSEKLQGR